MKINEWKQTSYINKGRMDISSWSFNNYMYSFGGRRKLNNLTE